MADIEVRPYELTNDPAPSDDVYIIVDHPDFTEPKVSTKTQFLADEVTARDDADTAIKDGAGLNSDGTFSSEPTSTYLRNSDFAAAGYDVNARNASLLLDYAISQLAQTQELNILINLSKADIENLNGVPVTKIAAPILGNHYHISEVQAKNNYTTSAWTCGANGIVARFVGGTDPIFRLSQSFVQSSSTVRKKVLVLEHEITPDAGIEFYAQDSDPTGGGGSIDVIMRYESQTDFASIPNVTKRCCVYPITDTFVNADLTASGNLVITHNLASPDVIVAVQDNTGAFTATTWTIGNELGVNPNNIVTVPIGLGITGTWRYMLLVKVI